MNVNGHCVHDGVSVNNFVNITVYLYDHRRDISKATRAPVNQSEETFLQSWHPLGPTPSNVQTEHHLKKQNSSCRKNQNKQLSVKYSGILFTVYKVKQKSIGTDKKKLQETYLPPESSTNMHSRRCITTVRVHYFHIL